MTLLEDARRLAELAVPMWEERFNDSGVCPHCGEYRRHASDCAMRALPRIVAALELAERYGITFEEQADGLHLISQRWRAS